MSLLDLLTHAWRMFWANILNPGSLMLFALVLIIALLAGFAMARTMSAMRAALRAISAVMVFILIYGLLGALGISCTGWRRWATGCLTWCRPRSSSPNNKEHCDHGAWHRSQTPHHGRRCRLFAHPHVRHPAGGHTCMAHVQRSHRDRRPECRLVGFVAPP